MNEDIFFKLFTALFSRLNDRLSYKKAELTESTLFKNISVSISFMSLGNSPTLGMGIISDLVEPIENDVHTFEFTFSIENLGAGRWSLNFFIGWASYDYGHITADDDTFEYNTIRELFNDLESKFLIYLKKYSSMCERPIEAFKNVRNE